MRRLPLALVLSLVVVGSARAQVLVRVGDPHRATYSELHKALRRGTPTADSVLVVTGERRPGALSAVISRTGKWLADWVGELEVERGT
jgi:hypothetical protein